MSLPEARGSESWRDWLRVLGLSVGPQSVTVLRVAQPCVYTSNHMENFMLCEHEFYLHFLNLYFLSIAFLWLQNFKHQRCLLWQRRGAARAFIHCRLGCDLIQAFGSDLCGRTPWHTPWAAISLWSTRPRKTQSRGHQKTHGVFIVAPLISFKTGNNPTVHQQ